jgi:hypothetical protein
MGERIDTSEDGDRGLPLRVKKERDKHELHEWERELTRVRMGEEGYH